MPVFGDNPAHHTIDEGFDSNTLIRRNQTTPFLLRIKSGNLLADMADVHETTNFHEMRVCPMMLISATASLQIAGCVRPPLLSG